MRVAAPVGEGDARGGSALLTMLDGAGHPLKLSLEPEELPGAWSGRLVRLPLQGGKGYPI